jgi:hypothetical protein
MKHGLEGYGGEEDEGENALWKTKEVNFFHILTRIKAEMEAARKLGFSYYPYLTTASSLSNLDLIKQKTRPIDVFFTPVQSEAHLWPNECPDLSQLSWDCVDSERHTRIQFSDSKIEKIPCPIRLGDGGNSDYPVFLMKDLEIYTYEKRKILDFTNLTYRNISTNTIIHQSLSGHLTFAVFEQIDNDTERSRGYQIDVAARAKIIPPYRAIALK